MSVTEAEGREGINEGASDRPLPSPVFVVDVAEDRLDVLHAEDDVSCPRCALTWGKIEDFFPDEGVRHSVLATTSKTVESGKRQRLEYELTSSTGRHVFDALTALLSREPARVLWVVQDVTERRDIASRLREREALLETLIESLPFDLWLLNPQGRYTLANSTACRRWGYPVGKRPADMNTDPEVLKIWEANNARALAGEVVRGEVTYCLNGETRHYVNILAPVRDREQLYGVVGLNLDVTDEKRLAMEMERRQRLESVGVLAGGVAHDFNNYLTVILAGLSLLQTQSDPPCNADVLSEMEQAAQRARALTRQLLTFAKGGTPVRQPTDIGPLVTETAALATHGLSCCCDTRIEQGLPLVDADPEQLRQVVHNLVLNAVQAMGEAATVRVVARRVAFARGEPEGVEIAVQDTGIGIPKELLDRVMEPYFTTKPDGHGLGLAITYSIVKKHGGVIAIESKEGDGTTVRVRLPASDAQTRAASI